MIGVVGGGQLARMLVQAAAQRDVPIAVQTSDQLIPRLVWPRASWQRIPGMWQEPGSWWWVVTASPSRTSGSISMPFCRWSSRGSFPAIAGCAFALVDKLSQRQLLDDLAIPSPPWCPLSLISPAQPALPQGWTFPVMAKASRGGYDGKGTVVLRDIDGLAQLLRAVPADDWLLESWVDYELELALVVSRDQRGRIRHFPLVQTHQHQQVCDWVLAPAPVDPSVAALAYNVAASLMTKLGYVGVLALEFFYGPAGLQVNEIAPRTHNSGHYSIEACTSSQFDQQLCIAAGLPVPDPELKSRGALMVNLLGLDPELNDPLDQRLQALEAMPGLHLHWYGKSPETPGRKLGHVTLLLEGETVAKRRDEAESALAAIRRIWPLASESQD